MQAHASSMKHEFLNTLSSTILGNDEIFSDLANNRGWQGVALAQVGATIEPLVQAYSGEPGDRFQLLTNTEIFGRPVTIHEGRVSFLPTSLAEIWKKVLESSAPETSLRKDRKLSVSVMRWLFRPLKKNGRTVGYSREESRFVRRYREFEARYSILVRAKNNNVWKLIPQLARFSTYEEAERSIIEEWIKAGYKHEVESAYWVFQKSKNPTNWSDWFIANENFKNNLETINFHQKLPVTFLLPPPSSWPTVSSWTRAIHASDALNGEFRFQFARVKILRPWFDIETIIDGRIKLGKEGRGIIVSEGTRPTFNKSGGGRIPGYVQEIILVRDIHFLGPKKPDIRDHPLAAFAYPEAINLLGYIVHMLPELGPEKMDISNIIDQDDLNEEKKETGDN